MNNPKPTSTRSSRRSHWLQRLVWLLMLLGFLAGGLFLAWQLVMRAGAASSAAVVGRVSRVRVASGDAKAAQGAPSQPSQPAEPAHAGIYVTELPTCAEIFALPDKAGLDRWMETNWQPFWDFHNFHRKVNVGMASGDDRGALDGYRRASLMIVEKVLADARLGTWNWDPQQPKLQQAEEPWAKSYFGGRLAMFAFWVSDAVGILWSEMEECLTAGDRSGATRFMENICLLRSQLGRSPTREHFYQATLEFLRQPNVLPLVADAFLLAYAREPHGECLRAHLKELDGRIACLRELAKNPAAAPSLLDTFKNNLPPGEIRPRKPLSEMNAGDLNIEVTRLAGDDQLDPVSGNPFIYEHLPDGSWRLAAPPLPGTTAAGAFYEVEKG